MSRISYRLVDKSKGVASVTQKLNTYQFQFPCSDSHDCTEYELHFQPGVYHIEMYGASGGYFKNYISTRKNENATQGCASTHVQGNTVCRNYPSMAGAGGYTSAVLSLDKPTKGFLFIGGKGSYGYKLKSYNTRECYLPENMQRGGFNGGGSSSNFFVEDKYGTGSGGGASDLRINENDFFHRIMVAGGGGGTDNHDGICGSSDDGSGGAGGGLVAQGFRVDGLLNTQHVATQSSGFSFGNGEAAQEFKSSNSNGISQAVGASDRPGGGGGWFGGFSSQHGNGGGGGGSSYILSKNSSIPTSQITVHDEFFNVIDTGKYSFDNESPYAMFSPLFESGIWDGNGLARITLIQKSFCSPPTKLQRCYAFMAVLCIIFSF